MGDMTEQRNQAPEPHSLWTDGKTVVSVNRVCEGRPGDGRVVRKWGMHPLTDTRWVEVETAKDSGLTAGYPIEFFLRLYKPVVA